MIRLVSLLICLATGGVAQQAAHDAARQLQDAAEQLDAAQSARDRIAALTAAVQAYEAGLSAMRARIRDVALQEVALQETLGVQRESMARLLGTLTRISRTPAPVQSAHPGGPIDTVRAGMLLADMTPALAAEAANLRTLLSRTQAIDSEQRAAAQTLEDGLIGAQTARATLAKAASERRDLPSRFADDPVQTALLVASAQTLDGFADALASERPDQSTRLQAQGDLPLPVAGIVLPDDGSGRPGVRIGTVPRALVTAPAPATVLFEGPLLDYGTVIVLEPATDVLFILAGLAEVFVQTGQILPAGAPIGLLGDAQRFNDGNLTENALIATGQAAQSLYLEVRDGQGPVNTDAWFALE